MKKKVTKKKTSKKAALYILAAVLLMIVLIIFSYRLISNGKKLTDKEISAELENFPYESIINGKQIKVSDLTNDQILYIGYFGLNDNQIVDKEATEDCVDKYGEISARCEAKELGLSEVQSNKLDTNLWKNIINYSNYYMFSLDSITATIKNKLNLDVKYVESFYKGLTLPGCGILPIVYDNNVNMFFTTEGLGCKYSSFHATYITSGYVSDDIYEIYLIEGAFNYKATEEDNTDKGYLTLTSRMNPDKKLLDNIYYKDLSIDYENDLLMKYSKDLDHYKLTFKKVGDNYQFVSIDYLD